MTKYHFKALILTVCATLLMSFGHCQNAQLILKVIGIEEAVGQICFAVYENEDDYKKSENQFKAGCVAIDEVNFQYIITDVPSGTYMISLFHDEDKNEELNTNWIGMPREPFGFSNDARGRMGPPKWEDAKFLVAGDRVVEINLIEL